MKTKHTIEVEVDWDWASDWQHTINNATGYQIARIHYSNGDHDPVSEEWLAARGITRPKHQPAPGVWYKIDDPAVEMPANNQLVIVRGGEHFVCATSFGRRLPDRTEFMVLPK